MARVRGVSWLQGRLRSLVHIPSKRIHRKPRDPDPVDTTHQQVLCVHLSSTTWEICRTVQVCPFPWLLWGCALWLREPVHGAIQTISLLAQVGEHEEPHAVPERGRTGLIMDILRTHRPAGSRASPEFQQRDPDGAVTVHHSWTQSVRPIWVNEWRGHLTVTPWNTVVEYKQHESGCETTADAER